MGLAVRRPREGAVGGRDTGRLLDTKMEIDRNPSAHFLSMIKMRFGFHTMCRDSPASTVPTSPPWLFKCN